MAGNNATVIVAPLVPEDSQAQYLPSANPLAIYCDYTIQCRYLSNEHRYMTGITSPGGFQGQSAAFVQLAAPTLLWVADWTALRSAQTPDIPDPDPDPRDPNWVLLSKSYEPAQLALYDDGTTPAFRISGTYVYGCKRPDPVTIKNVSYPRPAWIDDAFDRSIPTSALIQGLIKFSTTNPGAIGLKGQ